VNEIYKTISYEYASVEFFKRIFCKRFSTNRILKVGKIEQDLEDNHQPVKTTIPELGSSEDQTTAKIPVGSTQQ